MATTRTLQRSFAGGEMSPHMLARVDDIKFQNGYQRGRNFLVRTNGSLARRPGLRDVAGAKFNNKKHRLIAFSASLDVQYQVELGDLYFRFHQFGVPVRYATPRIKASVDTVAETITFTARHNFAQNDQVRFTNSTGLNTDLPDPLTAVNTYFVNVIDAKTIQVASLAFPTTPIDLTDAGIGTTYCWKASELPPEFVVKTFNFDESNVDVGNNEITVTAHTFETGESIRFTTTTTMPAPLVSAQVYYCIKTGVNTIKVAETLALAQAGTPIDLLSQGGAGISPHNVTNKYVHGDLVFQGGGGSPHGVYYCKADRTATGAPSTEPTFWLLEPVDGIFEIPSPYLEADLFEITFDQDNDVLTLAHEDYTVAELRRRADLRWAYVPLSFAPSLAAPITNDVVEVFGDSQIFTFTAATPSLFTRSPVQGGHGFAVGDSVYVETSLGAGGSFGGGGTPNPAGYYIVAQTGNATAGLPHNDLFLRYSDSTLGTIVGCTGTGSVYIRLASLNSESVSNYKITAVTADGNESLPSTVLTSQDNDLSIPGSSNSPRWEAVPGAARYFVYKKQSGLYSFLGKVDASEATFFPGLNKVLVGFKDDGSLIPDTARTIPIVDTTLGGSARQHPRAVTNFEQRRFFGGTIDEPQTLWATRTGSPLNLSFHEPLIDDDRLQFELKSREAVTIRHLVALEQLIVLSNSSEFRVIPVNSDVLTPTSLDAKTHDNVGASRVRPAVMSGNVIFCSNRGGHVYEMGVQPSGTGFSEPGDLCLRSNHLFDGKTTIDQSRARAPHQFLVQASSSGEMLLLTYLPQEQVGAWHVHSTDGVIESVSVSAEGEEDRIYCSVRRVINGSTVRRIEQMGAQQFVSLVESYHLDAGGTFDGRNTTATTMTVTGGVLWAAGETVTVTASATPTTAQFVLGSEDVGDHIVLSTAAAGYAYRIRIASVSTNKVIVGTLLNALPTELQGVATTAWGFARDTILLPHLEGKSVEILADGLVVGPLTVASGQIVLTTPGLIVQVGLPAQGELDTLPLSMQLEALGQGRPKNVNRTWIKVIETGAFRLGPDVNNLVPAEMNNAPGTVATTEVDTTTLPAYSQGGELSIRTTGPLPCSILGFVFELEVGG